jgi:hypothetical protein
MVGSEAAKQDDQSIDRQAERASRWKKLVCSHPRRRDGASWLFLGGGRRQVAMAGAQGCDLLPLVDVERDAVLDPEGATAEQGKPS